MPRSRSRGRKNSASEFGKGVSLYARLALGSAFLWGPQGSFAGFLRYKAEGNSFAPAATLPFLAYAATIAELTPGGDR
jgi:hypothetical protein